MLSCSSLISLSTFSRHINLPTTAPTPAPAPAPPSRIVDFSPVLTKIGDVSALIIKEQALANKRQNEEIYYDKQNFDHSLVLNTLAKARYLKQLKGYSYFTGSTFKILYNITHDFPQPTKANPDATVTCNVQSRYIIVSMIHIIALEGSHFNATPQESLYLGICQYIPHPKKECFEI